METGPDRLRRARPLLGTFVEITVMGTPPHEGDAAIEAAFETVAEIHDLMSFHRSESDVSRLNRKAATAAVTVDAQTYCVLEAALDLHHQTNGMFDIAVAPILQNLNLLPREPERIVFTADIPGCSAIELLSDCRVRFHDERIRVDLGGIAKGYAVDRALAVLRARNISNAVVNAGGDLAAFGPHTSQIHLRDPHDPCRFMCQVTIRNEALASSGLSFDPFRSLITSDVAVINPRERTSVLAVAGATVRASSCMIADALTKVVMIAGDAATAILDHYCASALLVLPNGDLWLTSNWRQHAVSLAT